MANASLYAKLDEIFKANAHRCAFDCAGNATISYGELRAQIAKAANALTAAGVEPGDRVMVQVDKSVANVAVYLATLKVGAVFNPLNTAYTTAELDYFMSDAKPRVLVVDPGRLTDLEPIAERNGVARVLTLDGNGQGTLAEAMASMSSESPIIEREVEDLAALLYTSGTTGRSKGAMITHGNLLSNAETLVAYWGFEGGDTLLHALPIFHVHGVFVALNTAFLSASRMIWLAKFDAQEVKRLLPQATVMMGVPTFYTRLLAEPDFGREHVSQMRLAISGSAPLLAETHDAFYDRTGLKIVERYGMTEAGMITSNPYHDGERIAGTVGFALPGIDVRIADDTGHAVGDGEVGVLEVKGPNVFAGYWQMPDKTKEEFRDDGFFISGDLATQGADGRITIVGRTKDLIISGGYNIYPKEIEQVLNDIDGVAESAVVGVPHPDFGEGVVAVVVASDPQTPPNPDAILTDLGHKLAKFKLPKSLFVEPELPRNAMGKVQKNVLRERHKTVLS